DDSRAYRGSSSIHFAIPALAAGATATARIVEHMTEEPDPPADHWIRVFFFRPEASLSATQEFDRMIVLSQDQDPYEKAEFGSSGHTPTVSSDFSLEHRVYSGTSTPTDRWSCLEVAFLSAAPGEIRLWLDGTEL